MIMCVLEKDKIDIPAESVKDKGGSYLENIVMSTVSIMTTPSVESIELPTSRPQRRLPVLPQQRTDPGFRVSGKVQ